MDDARSLLNALQHGDSFFPSGAVSFSWGLEAMVQGGVLAGPDDVQAFVLGQLHARWASFERTVVASAHRVARDLDRVNAIDTTVECMSPVAELRQGSRRLGGAMLSVFERMGSPAASAYRERQKARPHSVPGHVGAMQGLLWAETGLSETAALALSAHGFCTGLASAALRLGCLTHISAQTLLSAARMEVADIMAMPLVPLEDIYSHGIEAEIAVMRHAAQDARLFAN